MGARRIVELTRQDNSYALRAAHSRRLIGHNRSMLAPRLMRLRRPPVLVNVPGRFVPECVSLDQVDARWQALCAENERFFDGPMVHVLGVSRNGHGGVQIHVQECSYRFYAVQKTGLDCGVRPLGVKGITFARDEAGVVRVLVGQRSGRVAFYPRAWEFVPGGGLEPLAAPAEFVQRELREEAGLSALHTPIAIALLYDPCATTWEIVHRLEVDARDIPQLGWEYEQFAFVEPEQMPHPRASVADQMMPLACAVTRVCSSPQAE